MKATKCLLGFTELPGGCVLCGVADGVGYRGETLPVIVHSIDDWNAILAEIDRLKKENEALVEATEVNYG